MSMFDKAKTNKKAEKGEDRAGGGGNFTVKNGIYDLKIKMAYGLESKNGALGVRLILDIDGKEYTPRDIYYTKRTGETWYEKDGEVRQLPGFSLINDICMIATGKPLLDDDGDLQQEVGERTVKQFKDGKEQNVEVDSLEELIDAELKLAIQEQIEDKNQKGDDGEYHPTGETRSSNEIKAAFDSESEMTVNEAMAEMEEAVFADTWRAANPPEKPYDKSTGASGDASNGKQGAGKPNFGAKKSKDAGGAKGGSSMFKKKQAA